MPANLSSASSHQVLIQEVMSSVGKVLLGKESQTRLAVSCLLARGHLLLEDLPGVGKTTLAHALAKSFGLSYQRIQFTSDLLPADVTGAAIFDREQQVFNFKPGPVFTQLLLADEINRATPKTQSALLEAMEERQVTVDGESHALPKPFFVIATQNPSSQMGTYPLPESQLDRFLMRIELGYPDAAVERQLLAGGDPRAALSSLKGVLDLPQLEALQASIDNVYASDSLLDYVQRLVQHTRDNNEYPMPISPRGTMALLRAAKALAMTYSRDSVLPEDVQEVLPAVFEHRLRGASGSMSAHGDSYSKRVLNSVEVVA